MFSGGGGEVSYYLEGGFLLSGCLLCYRSSHQRCSIKKGVLKIFAKFTGKHLCQSLFFKKVAGLRSATLSKKRLWHKRFPMNFVRFSRTTFFKEHFRWLFLKHLCQCFQNTYLLQKLLRDTEFFKHFLNTMFVDKTWLFSTHTLE